jgi:hypothetical protein
MVCSVVTRPVAGSASSRPAWIAMSGAAAAGCCALALALIADSPAYPASATNAADSAAIFNLCDMIRPPGRRRH